MPDPDMAVRVGLDHDPDDPALIYTDIVSDVHYGAGGQAIEVTIGRQDEQTDIKPTELSWAVRNGDNRYTPNNPASDLYGKWEQGRRVQIAETVDGEEFILGTGQLEIPEMTVVDSRSSQPVTVSAVDRMGRLESAPAFLSTLTEYIRNTDAGPLVEYFPLSDPSHPMVSLVTSGVAVGSVGRFAADGEDQNFEDLLVPQTVEGPPGDDGRYAAWQPTFGSDAFGELINVYPSLRLPVSIPVGSAQVIAVSMWVNKGNPPPSWDSGTVFSQGEILGFFGTSAFVSVVDTLASGVATDTISVQSSAGNVTTDRRLERNAWRLVTARLDLAQSRLDLWVGCDLAVTVTGAPGAADTVVAIRLGSFFVGSIAHVQVRVGAGTIFTREDHSAQHRAGYEGLHRQTVAERIATIARYAGVPGTDVDVPAAASTPMQAAKLAGRGPAEVLRAAAETGQDTLLTNAAGKIAAVPRGQRYDQPVTMAIPFGWIERRGIRYRPDRPVTDVSVGRTGGGTTKRTDRARAARYGVTGRQYELDTAVKADPGNLADWTMAAYDRPRTRTPSIRIDMLRRTLAERKALLRLKVGDRIELTGLPAGSPEDLPDLIVQGIKHTAGPGRRRLIQFNTSPMLGPSPGVPPVGARVGTAVVGAATRIGY